MLHKAPDLTVVSGYTVDLLGSPIRNLEGIREVIQRKSEQLQLLGDSSSFILMMPFLRSFTFSIQPHAC